MSLLVTVSPSDLGAVVNHGSLIEVTGTSEDGEQRITFMGDHRPMAGFLCDIEATDEPQVAQVEFWMVVDVESVLLDCGCPRQHVADLGHQEGCKEA